MSIDNLFDHKCDIYHMVKQGKDIGYGIETQDFVYPSNPDEAAVDCHFNAEPGSIEQTETANEYIYHGKLQLPVGTDIRVNDRIVDKRNGLAYTAEIPKDVRGHHIIVYINRKGAVKGAL